MKRKTIGWAAIGPALLLALTLLASPPTIEAQQNRESCRCVDVDGNEIENCTCFRAPRMEGILGAIGLDSRPRMGISVDATQGARYDARGALVTDVMEGGPADDAGIRAGDVIVSIDGQALSEPLGAEPERSFDLDDSVPVQRLLAMVSEMEPGQALEVEYERDGERQTTIVEAEDLSTSWGVGDAFVFDTERFRDQMRDLAEGARGLQFRRDEWQARDLDERLRFRGPGNDFRFFAPGDGPVVMGGSGVFSDGLQLLELNPGLGQYFGAEEGVLVAEVGEDSGLGLEPGDVVLAVGDRDVTTPERFRRILSSYGDDENIDFRILRNGSEQTITGRKRYH